MLRYSELCYTELRKYYKNTKCSKRRNKTTANKTSSTLTKKLNKIRSLFFRRIMKT